MQSSEHEMARIIISNAVCFHILSICSSPTTSQSNHHRCTTAQCATIFYNRFQSTVTFGNGFPLYVGQFHAWVQTRGVSEGRPDVELRHCPSKNAIQDDTRGHWIAIAVWFCKFQLLPHLSLFPPSVTRCFTTLGTGTLRMKTTFI